MTRLIWIVGAGLLLGVLSASAQEKQAALTEAERKDLIGIQLMEEKRYEEAVAAFKQAIELEPGLIVVYRHLALAYTEMGRTDPQQFQQALAVYKQLDALAPEGDLETLTGRAYLQALMGEFAESEKNFETVLAHNPQDCEIWNKLGRVKEVHSQQVEAESGRATEEFKTLSSEALDAQLRVLELCPDQFQDYETLAFLFNRAKRSPEGAVVFGKLREKHPDNVFFARQEAYALFQSRQWEEATVAFGRLMEMDPEAMEDRLKYISALRKTEDLEEADRQLKIYLEQKEKKEAQKQGG